ncbi:MAG: hypothetical protein EA427_17570 [Spirochaetaceae bacterium]|nr:MAG: hypothetical protein EA427_17570 [Spirochaetaceae bacterium]
MIPREMAFHRADTVAEAVGAWRAALKANGRPLYYSGGTEIITLTRENKLDPTDLVDIKAIPETRVLAVVRGGEDDETDRAGAAPEQSPPDQLQLGAALSLNTLVDVDPFPLLAHCAAGVADRTIRNSITLGGNICGMLPYREAVLPFLLLDGMVEIAGGDTGDKGDKTDKDADMRRVPLRECFRKRLVLREGELVVRFILDATVLPALEGDAESRRKERPGKSTACGFGSRGGWYYQRRTVDSRIDYPIVTLAMVLLDGVVRVATTGTWGYPHRALQAEAVCSAEKGGDFQRLAECSREQLLSLAAGMVDGENLPVKADFRAGREYRRELTVQALAEGLSVLAGGGDT